ncbi:unnamed protein product [Thelazia callipaeda]|uniref:Dentin sialophosphoprotein-like n=1 Tax=Thelazia callipaeda TaxID=103827 RepID=A0A0N5DBN3_THECL|nr:unnamed protein product [Thelazia callipaeda]
MNGRKLFGCSELAAMNTKLSVRRVVGNLCANPQQTVEKIVNGEYENSEEPIEQLVSARLKQIYQQLLTTVLSPSDEPPFSESALKFLNGFGNRSEKYIISSFSKQHESKKESRSLTSAAGFLHSPSVNTISCSEGISINSLPEITDDEGRQNSVKVGKKYSSPSRTSFSSTTSKYSLKSTSTNSSMSSHSANESKSNGKLRKISYRRKSNMNVSNYLIDKSTQHQEKVDDHEVMVEIGKAVSSMLLVEGFIESVPPLDTITNAKKPMSSCLSQQSDEDKETVKLSPSKILKVDAAVSTDIVVDVNRTSEKVNVGVNTSEITNKMTDGSSSSNTLSDNSVGQLPKRLFDTVLQRSSLRIVSMLPDGSIVPTSSNSVFRRKPSVQEWIVEDNEDNVQESSTSERKLESGTISTSQPDLFEEDLNTLDNISPLPKFTSKT